MSYGLLIQNTSGKTIINTEQPFIGEAVGSAQFVNTAGTAWPPSGLGTNELPLFSTKSSTNGILALFYGDYGISAPTFNSVTYGAPSNGFQWRALIPQNTLSGSDYGLKCFNSNGIVAFDSTRLERSVDIVAAGTTTAINSTFFFESGRDPEKYVVDLIGSRIATEPVTILIDPVNNTYISYTRIYEQSYFFDKTNNKLVLYNRVWNDDGNPPVYQAFGAPFRYLIGYVRD